MVVARHEAFEHALVASAFTLILVQAAELLASRIRTFLALLEEIHPGELVQVRLELVKISLLRTDPRHASVVDNYVLSLRNFIKSNFVCFRSIVGCIAWDRIQ